MIETEPTPRPATPAPVRPPQPGRPAPAAPVVVLVLLGMAVVYGAWRYWPRGAESPEAMGARLSQDVAALQAQQQAIEKQQSELLVTVQKNDARLDVSEQTVAKAAEAIEGGRRRVQLAAVEELLLLASDRAQLAHDVPTALRALEIADQRLAALSDPRVLKVREALATERRALAAVPHADVAGAVLGIGEIVKSAALLPLRAQVPAGFHVETQPVPVAEGDGLFERVGAAVRSALSAMFALRRTDGPPPRLLAAEEEAMVRQVLQLKLEGARLALLAGDGASYRDLIIAGDSWLAAYYNPDAPAVKAARAQLQKLGAMDLVPKLPELGRSLAVLRELQ